ncbi:MAG: F0F1 ATP synthase subunit A, partial [Chloroflexi bacterium]|nr:F0F1 ATP synthase subunit A [Chloroflexota bacterium]
MSKLGCSSRLGIILIIVLVALLLTSFIAGPLGSKLFKISVPHDLQVSVPHVVLPSEAMFHVGDFKITNTLISSWITIILLVLIFFFATRRMKLIPGRFQSFAEVIVEGIYGTIQGIAGEKHVRTFFPTATVIVPFLRAANTDVNLTLSIALVSFCFIEFLGFTKIGPLHYIDSFFQFSAIGKAIKNKQWGSAFGFGFINIYVGLLEILSHFIRVISFTFRLFGNMTAGEILLGV